MNHIDFIKKLDHKSNRERFVMISAWLNERGIVYHRHEYATGINLLVDLGASTKRIGIGSHYDVVKGSGGANDNGSAIAVCLNIIERYKKEKPEGMGARVFFFDEEETGLKGSAAYTRDYGVSDLTGLLNLELVGMGDKFALWPLDQKNTGSLLKTFEQAARKAKIDTIRFDKIITNTADHLSFRNAGLADAFTITCISEKDMTAAGQYYKALERGTGQQSLFEILSKAPIFTHYHSPTDTYEKLEESAMAMTADTIWEIISPL